VDATTQPPEPGSATASPGGRWARAGVLSAGLWFLATLAVTLWNAQPGNQKIGALVVLVAGPLAFLMMGRVHRLRGPGDWSRAAILTIGLYAVACFIALVLLVIVSWHPA
jgi:hypothetical protein